MSDEEDYLSDKFLVEAVASPLQPKTYAQKRQESLKQSRFRNEQNRLKSRRQREQESREEGLHKSLFQRAIGDNEGGQNKALGIMLKMGFKIGESLGQKESPPALEGVSPLASKNEAELAEGRDTPPDSLRRTEPLPLNEWTGKKGIGLGKRARSPGASDRLVKMAKMAEDASNESFRDFARRDYEERRAESRLAPAQRTCANLDGRAGIPFNVLWLHPNEPDSIPNGLRDALLEYTQDVSPVPFGNSNEATRLRDQMRADALQPVTSNDDETTLSDLRGAKKTTQHEDFPVETVQETVYFFRLRPRDRLNLVLTYLRDNYAYCFWCGTQYEDSADLEEHCPGPNEDDHD